MLVVFHLVFIAVVGSFANTVIGIHDFPTQSDESAITHHHHSVVAHSDHGNTEGSHQHGAENIQPVGFLQSCCGLDNQCDVSTFGKAFDNRFQDIYPKPKLKPPRVLL